MQIDRILGNVGVLYVGVYNPSTQYEYLNCVTYNGSSYVCVNQNGVTGVTPGTTNDWQLSAQKGDTGAQGIQGEQGIQGATGNGIQSIEKTSSNALTDTYTILFTDGSSTTFEVENGKGIVSIEKTSSEGNVDTYTITYNDDTTSTFTVTNGEVTNEELQQALAQERVISDGKYARALKTQVTDVESTQIYAENDVVDDLVIKGAELTQTVTEQSENIILLEDYPTTNNNGIDVTVKDNKVTLNGTASASFNLKLPIKYITSKLLNGNFCMGYISEGDFEAGNGNLTLYSSNNQNIPLYFPKSSNSNNNYNTRNVSDFNLSDKSLNLYIVSGAIVNNLVIDFTLANVASLDAGIPFTPESPSIDFPSEVKVASEQNITINETNITIPLTNSAIGQYADTIDRKNNLQNKVIQELILTGDEDWTMAYGDGMFGLENSEIKFNINSKIALSNYFKFNSTISNIYNTLLDNEFAFQFFDGKQKCFIKCIQFNSVTDWKAKLQELYQAGTPVKIYYVAEKPTTNPLPQEVQTALSNFKLYQDLNNVAIDGGSMSFIYNKSLIYTINQLTQLVQTLSSEVQALQTPTTEPTVETTSEVQADG